MATKSEPQRGIASRVDWLSERHVELAKRLGFHALLWSLVFVVLLPVIWMAIVSLNSTPFDTFVQNPGEWLSGVSFEAYRSLRSNTEFLTWLWNSLLVSLGATALAIVVCTLSAYSIGRLRFRGRRWVATFLLITQMFPAVLIALPMYLVFADLGLYDTLWGLVIAYVAFTLPFAVWMLRGFYENLPESLEEAAMIDGSTRFGAVIRVIVPLSAPAIATTSIFTWVLAWNEYVFALILLRSEDNQTLPPGMGQWVGQQQVNWDLMMAGAVGATIPLMIVFFLLQNYIVQGLAEGAVKS